MSDNETIRSLRVEVDRLTTNAKELRAEVERLKQQIEGSQWRKENDILRGIATKIMPCHYCGVDSLGKCPHGFPGCGLADDITCCEETTNAECRALKQQLTAAQAKRDAWKADAERLEESLLELQDATGNYPEHAKANLAAHAALVKGSQ